tara:strand:+ start:1894 stop:2619 length:726 start_codon:yes stop_codon:yes gene_type:complete
MISFDILTKEITEMLIKNELLDVLVKKELLNEEIREISISEEEESDIRKMIYQKEKITDDLQFNDWLEKNNTNKEDFFRNISKPLRLNKYCLNEFSKKTEARFLAKKDMLGTVTYNLIRVKDFFQAQELYLRIQEDPLQFGTLAKKYSLGPEKDTQGLVGPVPLNQGHPGLLRELRISKIGEIAQPLKIEDFWVILRLESRIEAKLDKNMQLILSKELFDEHLKKRTNEEILALKAKYKLN